MGLTADQAAYLVSLCAGKCSAADLIHSQPAREVWLDGYLIYKTEVTNAMYANCARNGSCGQPVSADSNLRNNYYNNPTYADYPVVHVDWYSASNYCQWAGGRLPTEAEWEKAARGPDGQLFPWGDEAPTDQLANNNALFNDTTPIGAFPAGASPYGVLDMTGNVWEWTADWYEADYYSYAPAENPQGPTTSSVNQRTGRGGSWEWNHAVSSATYHDWWEPYKSGSGVGFRCVLDLPD
jgi:formylglycine-generating enzyme required for sulfatase activity